MTGAKSMNWYVAQTHTNAEAKATTHLERQGFATYLPRYMKMVRHSRRVSFVSAPLFPRYIFLNVDMERQRWRAINSTIGITQLIGHHGHLLPVQKEIIEGLRRREGADGLLKIDSAAPRFKSGDAVRVLRGAFDVCEAIFDAQTASDRVVILLDLLGRRVRAVLAADAIEAV